MNWLLSVAGIEVVDLSAEKNNAHEVEGCSGLVLSGGIDVHPRYYNNPKLDYEGANGFNEARDQFEKEVFELAQKKRIPVLGVCRGLQFVNCLMGGTLIQDLGDLKKIHEGGPDKIHEVNVVGNTLLQRVSSLSKGNVNSSHHQAIEKLGNGLTVNCRADDGTIEGIERSDPSKPFLLAVQWHPERMEDKDTSPLSKNIRDSFLQAARNK
ncbi:MAG TPA: gamma-glutamyl-gamma-aminobutyrate hydrolase family protein [Cyclobacteriaceae bacterium]|jgi:putative glutamine amidotransferase|nr:gamma-glutamyl-gamma-aminobutyrate hydrolase family protein [Cyclobacteriaceae bacterium]